MRLYFPKQYDLKFLHDKASEAIPDFSSSAFYKIIYLLQEANFRSHYMGYLPSIHSRKFKKVSSAYRGYLTFLEEQNLIKRNDYFIVNEQSYLYQFTFKYHENLNHSHLIKGISLPSTDNIYINQSPTNYTHLESHIIDKFKLFLYYLNFDSMGAKNLMEDLLDYRQKSPDIDYSHWNWLKDDEDFWRFTNIPKPLDPKAQYNFEQKITDKLTDNEYYCHADTSGWRVHTPLTILPREYKKFVTFRGQELFSIDLKCSQVFLTLSLLNPAFWDVDNECESQINVSALEMEHLFSTAEIHEKTINAINELGDDYERFKKHCCNGNIYEYMQVCYKSKLGLDINRDDVKIQFYLTLFTANTFFGTEQARPKRLFAELFPSVYNVFKAIKTQRNKEVLYLNDHDSDPVEKFSTLLPIMLQRLESHIFIKNIASSIIENHPHIPIFTIHDSISTTEEYTPFVERVIQSEIEKITGLSPTLKITSWNEESQLMQSKIDSLTV